MRRIWAFAVVAGASLFPFGAHAIELTKSKFESGLRAYVKEVPQCAGAKLSAGKAGAGGWLYQFKNSAELEVRVLADGQQIRQIEVTALDRNESALQDMLCATIALMRSIQPEYVTTSDAVRDAKHLWENAGDRPFTKAFYFDTFIAQLTPVMLTVK
ncbi:hypothetical protein [Achromobacter animicus]|uniref:hypothetical protein n=1 Tax=Achromobacter animicus TaxID=1389935 RepID=UPI00345E9BF7